VPWVTLSGVALWSRVKELFHGPSA
jgi:hypothetical protein